MQLVKIIDNATGNVLYTCSVENIEKAYTEAANFEAYGLDVSIHAPTVTQTLAYSLGLPEQEQDIYQQSVLQELEDHDGSCCASNKDSTEQDQ